MATAQSGTGADKRDLRRLCPVGV